MGLGFGLLQERASKQTGGRRSNEEMHVRVFYAEIGSPWKWTNPNPQVQTVTTSPAACGEVTVGFISFGLGPSLAHQVDENPDP